ncbi:MAG: hypothetical protein LC808_14790 [Actinobacteria bacterium]|nr:hypothetical protein [Actinomycetota bacterium]
MISQDTSERASMTTGVIPSLERAPVGRSDRPTPAALALPVDSIMKVDATTVGDLQGRYAVAPLVTRAEAIADATRASMLEHLVWFRRQFDEWLSLITDLREGSVDARRAAITGAAFRPNFHAARAAEHLESEQWTEATLRYVLAGETLVRDVIMSALDERLDANLTPAELTTHWRKTAPKLSLLAGVDLGAQPAWEAFAAVYSDRNARFGHGHEEATVEDALRARAAWADLRTLMQKPSAVPTRPSVTVVAGFVRQSRHPSRSNRSIWRLPTPR